MSLEIPDVIALETVTDASGAPEDHVDVIVVGMGIAGSCAALEAARSGARVILLERAAEHGGTSAMAGGHFYLGGGTAVQRATQQPDSADEMFKYLMAITPYPDEEKIRVFTDDAADHLDWIEALGMEFERSYYPYKAVIQPGTEGLMYTGNEKVWPYREQAVPAPRGHKVPVPGDTGGAKMVLDLLRSRLEEAGVDIRFETAATNLIADESGAVAGVRWRKYAEKGSLRAPAVIIAAGGFIGNEEMVAHYLPAVSGKVHPLASSYDDGLGIRLGVSMGGELQLMQEPFLTSPFYPPGSTVTGLVVNKLGKRFVAEDSYHSRTSGFILDQPGSAAYLILDSPHMANPPSMPLAPLIDGFETIAEMEASLGMPDGELQATVAAYNENTARGEDPEFHKHADWLEPQDQGPWGVFDLTVGTSFYTCFTLGGLRVDHDGRVIGEDDSVVTGLYAVGACAVNIAQDAKGYASGTQLAEGSYFGRRAGRHAAQ